jgi:DNA polymerase III subunit delta
MAKAPSTSVSALQFLTAPGEHRLGPVCAVVGDDAFLRHEVRLSLARVLDSGDEQGFALETCDGRSVNWRDVVDALSERCLFVASCRAVVVEDADVLVKNYREKIEAYVDSPVRDALLVLEVTTWPANTRLAKAVARSGLTIRCQVPQSGRERTDFIRQLKDWLVHVARDQFEVELQRPAVDLLLDLLPTEVGILYQEVAKLSLLADGKKGIDADLVREYVGGWRTRTTWDMIDAAAEGRAADALAQLDRLLAAGEEPYALLPQMASTLRRFAGAARAYEQAEQRRQPMSLRAALEQSGTLPYKLSPAEAQLRQIGRPRAKQLYRWLLAADLAMKGHNSTKDRARRELETLIVRLSGQTRGGSR